MSHFPIWSVFLIFFNGVLALLILACDEWRARRSGQHDPIESETIIGDHAADEHAVKRRGFKPIGCALLTGFLSLGLVSAATIHNHFAHGARPNLAAIDDRADFARP